MKMDQAITEAELNFLRIVALVYGPGHNAVRKHFDSQFPPHLLKTQLATVLKPRLERLKQKKVINGMQWSILYHSNDAVSSGCFDVPLMVTLLRNFDTKKFPTHGLDDLPDDADQSPVDDLARIKYYRNLVAHSKDCKLDSNEEYSKILQNIYDAITRLGGKTSQCEADRLVSSLSFESRHIYKELIRNVMMNADHLEWLSSLQNKVKGDLSDFQNNISQREQNIRQMITDIITQQDAVKRHLEENLEEMTNQINQNQSPIPKGLRAQHVRQIQSWIKEEEKYVSTDAFTKVENLLEKNHILTVTGNAGCGKTALIRHIALQLTTKGYDIVPVVSPRNIVEYHDETQQQVFIIDDAYGIHTIDPLKKSEWKDYSKMIEECLHHSNGRLLISIRLGIFNNIHMNEIKLLKHHVVNLQDELYRLTHTDRSKIFKSYFDKDYKELGISDISLTLHDSFPLLCRISSQAGHFEDEFGGENTKFNSSTNLDIFFKTPVKLLEEELQQMSLSSPLSYCVLLICVLFNGKLPKEAILNSQNYKTLIKDSCESCGLSRSTSRKVLFDTLISLTNVYITDLNGEIVFIHDIIMDIVARFIGQNVQGVILKHASPEFIRDRVRLEISNHETEVFAICIQNEFTDIFFEKVHREIVIGNAWLMFDHKQITLPRFQALFVKYLNTISTREIQEIFFSAKDIIPDLYSSQVLKVIDKMIEFIELKPVQLDFKILLYLTVSNAFQWVLGKGLYIIVKFLEMKMQEQVYQEVKEIKEFCSFLAIIGGNINVYKWLINVIKENQNIWTPIFDFVSDTNHAKNDLMLACIAGQTHIVEFICQNKKEGTFFKSEIKYKQFLMLEVYFLNGKAFKTSKLLMFLHRHIFRVINWFTREKVKQSNIESQLHECEQMYCYIFFSNDQKINKIIYKKIKLELLPAVRSRLEYVNDSKKPLVRSFDYYLREFDLNLTMLDIATIMGIESVVEIALKYGANPNYTCTPHGQSGEEGCAPITRGAMFGRRKIVEILLDNGADINATGKPNDCTLLMLASSYGHFELVKFLLLRKVEIDARNKLQNTALLYASRKGHIDIVRYFLLQKANPNISGENGTTALLEAVKHINFECVKILLEYNADIQHYDSEHMTSIMWAANIGHLEITETLFNNNADINTISNTGKTALMLATKNGHSEIVSQILTWKHKADIQNSSSKSFYKQEMISLFSVLPFPVLHSAIQDNNHEINQAFLIALEQNNEESVRLLLENGANVNIEYESGIGSALCRAVSSSNLNIVNILLQYNPNINAPNSQGWTPLLIACAFKHVDIAKLLVDNDAKINIKTGATITRITDDFFSQTDIEPNIITITPLIIAVVCRQLNTVNMLLNDKQIKVDMKTSDNLTALMVACLREDSEIVKTLLEHGANPNNVSTQGLTPLSIAEMKENYQIKQLLVKSGSLPVTKETNKLPFLLDALVSRILRLMVLLFVMSNVVTLVE